MRGPLILGADFLFSVHGFTRLRLSSVAQSSGRFFYSTTVTGGVARLARLLGILCLNNLDSIGTLDLRVEP